MNRRRLSDIPTFGAEARERALRRQHQEPSRPPVHPLARRAGRLARMVLGILLAIIILPIAVLLAFGKSAMLIAHGVRCGHDTMPVLPSSSVIPERFRGQVGPRPALGFRYSYISAFGFDLWTWNGAFCVYASDGAILSGIAREQAAAYLIVPDDTARRIMVEAGFAPRTPFLYRYPAGWILALVVLALGGPAALLIRAIRARTTSPPLVLTR